MNNSTPDVLEQVPAGGGMNKPASGTYGEGAELERLKQQLPSSDQQPQQPSPAPTPPSGGMGGGGVGPPPSGLPRGLASPTQRPDVPVSTPLQGGPPADPLGGAVDARQRRLQYIDLLSQHADSAEVREWAETVKQKLIAGV